MSAALLARYRIEMRDFDSREQKYKPRWQITPTGAALLLHREIEHQDPERAADVDAAAEAAEGGDA
ncbi:hypothetical protein [Acidithiobacillus thiooxidans]|uniref:hypothetical protein n=1 Tax=Acidithiobacillus thiooxidans TaxID=930 RepID=UPI0004E11373|nr:hypothetical protein [Acidithiobacillus thiooxidans]